VKYNDPLHMAAQKYAETRLNEAKKIRREKKLIPVDPDPNRDIYLAHYEAFKAGYHTGKRSEAGFARITEINKTRVSPVQEEPTQEDAVREGLLYQMSLDPRIDPE